MRASAPWPLIVALSLLPFGCAPSAPERPGGAASSARREPPVVTLAEYRRLQPRMTYLSVRMVVGAPGKELASNYEPTIRGVLPSGFRRIYIWKNPDGSSLTALFEDDALVLATQSDLR